MRPVEQWIWLPEERYPGNQITRYSERVNNHIAGNYTVAAFSIEYLFPKAIQSVDLRFSGDTAFALFCNDVHIANGPVLPGGDFLSSYNNDPLPQHYATEMVLEDLDDPQIVMADCPFAEGAVAAMVAAAGGASLEEVKQAAEEAREARKF